MFIAGYGNDIPILQLPHLLGRLEVGLGSCEYEDGEVSTLDGAIEWWTKVFAREDAPHILELRMYMFGIPLSSDYTLEDFDAPDQWRTLDETVSRASIGKVAVMSVPSVERRFTRHFYSCVLPRTVERFNVRLP